MTTTPARWLRQSIAAMAGSLLMLSFSSTALAGAPQVKTQAPGFYRMMLGDFEVTALFDGTLDLEPKKLLTNTTQEQVGKLLDRGFEKDAVPTSVNGYLINTGSKLVLVDTGAGGLFGPTLGNLQANLKAAGYQPEQVDDVLITHMHGDHVGGLVQDGKLVFPNATIHAGQEDADFWLNKANLEKASAEMKGFFQGAMASLNPYVEAGKFKGMKGGTELAPGIKAVPAHGHTPGHNIYVVESKGQKLVLWGDLMHVAAVQFDDPAVTIKFDSDSAPAAKERALAYAAAAKGGYLVGSAHIAFPGLGHVRKAGGKSYTWVPLNYSSLK